MIKISVNLENMIKISINLREYDKDECKLKEYDKDKYKHWGNKGATRLGYKQGNYSPVRESPQSPLGCRRSPSPGSPGPPGLFSSWGSWFCSPRHFETSLSCNSHDPPQETTQSGYNG